MAGQDTVEGHGVSDTVIVRSGAHPPLPPIDSKLVSKFSRVPSSGSLSRVPSSGSLSAMIPKESSETAAGLFLLLARYTAL